MSFAENTPGRMGYIRFAEIETSQGIEVADAARFGKEARKNGMKYSDLQNTVEFLNAKHGELLAKMERKGKCDTGVP